MMERTCLREIHDKNLPHAPTKARFDPRPLTIPEQIHEAPSTEFPGRAAHYDHSIADIDIFPRTIVQPKLALGPAGDRYEQEADRVARQVVTAISSEKLAVSEFERYNPVQRISAPSRLLSPPQGSHVAPETEASIRQARFGGQPLSDDVRAPMERAFGADFSKVRVHADGRANSLNRSLQARAFTTGQDIFLGQGEYRPGSSEGQRLLAHELTHVVQQRTKVPSLIQRVVDWRILYQQCLQNVFGARRRLSWGGRRVPPQNVASLILQVTGTGAGIYGPEDLAVVWAIETNFTTNPRNNQNPNGFIDIGPVQINYQAHSPGMSKRRRNAIFGTNLGGGETFNGDILANLRYGWSFLQRRGHEGYNPGSTTRPAAIAILLPELSQFFGCMIAGRTITVSKAEAGIV